MTTDWDARWIKKAYDISKWSTCLRRKVGAVLVKDKEPIRISYNGAVKNAPHCSETGCVRERDGIPSGQRLEHCVGAHAEGMAVIKVAAHIVKGATLYTTTMPCPYCATLIVNSGVCRLVYCEDYRGLGRDILESGGVEIVHLAREEKSE